MKRNDLVTLYSYGKMPILMKIISSLWARVGPYLSIHIELLEDLSSSILFHETMLNSFVARDYETLVQHLKCDLHESYTALSPLVTLLHSNGELNSREQIVSRILDQKGRSSSLNATATAAEGNTSQR